MLQLCYVKPDLSVPACLLAPLSSSCSLPELRGSVPAQGAAPEGRHQEAGLRPWRQHGCHGARLLQGDKLEEAGGAGGEGGLGLGLGGDGYPSSVCGISVIHLWDILHRFVRDWGDWQACNAMLLGSGCCTDRAAGLGDLHRMPFELGMWREGEKGWAVCGRPWARHLQRRVALVYEWICSVVGCPALLPYDSVCRWRPPSSQPCRAGRPASRTLIRSGQTSPSRCEFRGELSSLGR